MRDITRAAEKRLSNLERGAAEQFESSIVHNRVWEALSEDDRLRHVLDVTERAYELDERDDLPEEMDMVAFGAAEDLNDHIDSLVEQAVARECAAILKDGRDDWFDDAAAGRASIRDAIDEAAKWLADHRDAAEREGIDVDEVWMTSDELDLEVNADV